MIIDGRAIASELLSSVRTDMQLLGRTIVVRAVTMQPSPATKSYLAIKAERAKEAGMTLDVIVLKDDATQEEVHRAIQAEGADAVIVQLPLPPHIDTPLALSYISPSKDADVLSRSAYERFEKSEEDAILPPVVGAVSEILRRTNTPLLAKNVCVIGEGKLVGKPVATWFLSQGAHISVITRTNGDLSLLKDADIIVSGAGQANLITPELLTKGVVLIDAGTSESNGALAGDASPSCADVAGVFTPVPGGVGPIAVAYLFKNVASLLSK